MIKKLEVKQNWIDKAISYLDPVTGARRMHARMNLAVSGAWNGASKSRRGMKGRTPTSGDANDENNPDLDALRDNSRDLVRNTPLATGAVNTVCTNVVGPGLKLFPQIDREFLNMTEAEADEWERKTKREFNCWAESKKSDTRDTLAFPDMQELAFRSALEGGDVFCNMPMITRARWPYRLTLQLIEADRVNNPDSKQDTETLSAGVEKNARGAPVAYQVSSFHPGNVRTPGQSRKWTRVPVFSRSGRRNIIHLFKTLRPGQSRGVPYLAPVIEPLRQLGRYTDAELMAAVVSGMFTVFITTPEGEANLNPMEPTGETGGKTTDDDYKLGNGAMIGLAPGDKIETANPGRPNTGFDQFVLAISRQVGVALELPFEILVKHFTASYSAARGALLEAWKFFKARRLWLARNFCDPVYEAWMEDAVSSGRIAAPGFFDDPIIRRAYLKAMWIGPAKGQIDEKKEIDAAKGRLGSNLTTHEQETIELNGGDFETNAKQLGKEQRLIKEAGIISASTPAPVGVSTEDPPPGNMDKSDKETE